MPLVLRRASAESATSSPVRIAIWWGSGDPPGCLMSGSTILACYVPGRRVQRELVAMNTLPERVSVGERSMDKAAYAAPRSGASSLRMTNMGMRASTEVKGDLSEKAREKELCCSLGRILRAIPPARYIPPY